MPVHEHDPAIQRHDRRADAERAQEQAERERERLISELEAALENVKTLRGLLPICAHCKRIRDDKGEWTQVEQYVRARTDAQFSHGICPDCLEKMYPGFTKRNKKDRSHSRHTQQPHHEGGNHRPSPYTAPEWRNKSANACASNR